MQNKIMDMARQAHLDVYGLAKDRDKFVQVVEAFAKLVAAKEREEILGLADSLGWVNIDHIQARGQ